jgi:hypothetical protein
VPRTSTDLKQLVDSHEYGSKAEIKVKAFRIEGSPAFERGGSSGSHVSIEPFARKFRLGIVVKSEQAAEKVRIELDAELARGSRGWEVRSADTGCPLELVLRLDTADDDKNKVTIGILYERWNGRPFAELPILDQLVSLAQCFERRGRLVFEWIEFGERREMLSTTVQADRTQQFRQTLSYLDLLGRVSQICRRVRSPACYQDSETIDPSQIESFGLAYELTSGRSVSFSGFSSTLTPTPEGRQALADPASHKLQLSMPLRLHFGRTFIGEVPVAVAVGDYTMSDNADGTIRLTPKSPVAMSLGSGTM